MNKEALLKVAEILETLPDNKNFNMMAWKKTTPCGTVACAIGHAAMHPWFIKRGFRMSSDGVPAFDGSWNWFAVEKFFDINYADANYLFNVTKYGGGFRVDRIVVANRIRAFVNEDLGIVSR